MNRKMSKKEIQYRKQIKILEKKYLVMKTLSTDFGFFLSYQALNETFNNKEFAFNRVNDLYKDFFDEHKFKNLNDFFENAIKFKMN